MTPARVAIQEIVRRMVEADLDTVYLDIHQALQVVENAGSFAKAFRRWKELDQASGSFEDLRMQMADIVIGVYVAAQIVGIEDLDDDIAARIQHVLSQPRGNEES